MCTNRKCFIVIFCWEIGRVICGFGGILIGCMVFVPVVLDVMVCGIVIVNECFFLFSKEVIN